MNDTILMEEPRKLAKLLKILPRETKLKLEGVILGVALARPESNDGKEETG